MYGKHHHGVCRFKSSLAKPWQKEKNSKANLRQMSKQIQFLMKRDTKQNEDAMSVSSDNSNTPDWRRGLKETQAMYVATLYREDNNLSYDEQVHSINPDDLNPYKKRYKQAKKFWNENQAVHQVGVKQRKIQKQYNPRELLQQQYCDIIIMVKDKDEKGMMLCALLGSGCWRTIILKQFTHKSNRHLLPDKDKIRYTTYGGYFTSDSVHVATISFKLIEFNSYKEKLINYEVQVDSVQQRKNTKYNIIIGSDLMNDLGINLNYSDNSIVI